MDKDHPGEMITEDITLMCPHCGTSVVKHIGWIQAHRDFRCERCGRASKLDKDRLSLVLAGRKPPVQIGAAQRSR